MKDELNRGFSPIFHHFGLKPTSNIYLPNGINAVAIHKNPKSKEIRKNEVNCPCESLFQGKTHLSDETASAFKKVVNIREFQTPKATTVFAYL